MTQDAVFSVFRHSFLVIWNLSFWVPWKVPRWKTFFLKTWPLSVCVYRWVPCWALPAGGRRFVGPTIMISIPPWDTFPHQDSASTAPSGTSPPAQSPPPPQTRWTQSHSAPTPLKRPIPTARWSAPCGTDGPPTALCLGCSVAYYIACYNTI